MGGREVGGRGQGGRRRTEGESYERALQDKRDMLGDRKEPMSRAFAPCSFYSRGTELLSSGVTWVWGMKTDQEMFIIISSDSA